MRSILALLVVALFSLTSLGCGEADTSGAAEADTAKGRDARTKRYDEDQTDPAGEPAPAPQENAAQ